MRINPIQAADFYKVGHKFQYPEGTQFVYSNFTARSDRLAVKTGMPSDGKIIWYGLQGFMKWFLIDCFNENFFKVPKEKVIAEYNRRMNSALGTGSVNPSHIAELHDLGYLPIQIRALPEGSLVDIKVPVMTIVNTDERFYWLTNYLETVLSAEIWKSTTSATTAFKYRELLEQYAKTTGSPMDFVLWQGHDFSFRGLSGVHDAASSGSGHLTSFLGTDTIPAMQYLEDYYSGLNTFVGGSVPATEHSVMCMGGKETEVETFRRLITEVYPAGVVSIVSDTWDFWQVISETAAVLKEEILNRTPNEIGLAKVVFRPDSGDPADILCGVTIQSAQGLEDAVDMLVEDTCFETPHGEPGEDCPEGLFRFPDGKVYSVSTNIEWNRYDKQYYYYDGRYGDKAVEVQLTPEQKGAVEVLWDIFGGTMTDTGHRLLNQRVGLIYGDSITLERAKDILSRLSAKGFASANVVFGIGSYTYQHVTRDTYGFAVKSTWGMINGIEQEIFKDPKTDNGVKKSARGLLRVYKTEAGYSMEDGMDALRHVETYEDDAMQLVFNDGELCNETTLEEIRQVVNSHLTQG